MVYSHSNGGDKVEILLNTDVIPRPASACVCVCVFMRDVHVGSVIDIGSKQEVPCWEKGYNLEDENGSSSIYQSINQSIHSLTRNIDVHACEIYYPPGQVCRYGRQGRGKKGKG